MPQTDLPLPELRAYRPTLTEPDDLDTFWADTIEEARAQPLEATFEPVSTGLSVIESWDVTFRGFGGSPVKGWFHRPAGQEGPLASVVEYVGYGGGRGLPHEKVLWAAAGYAYLVMDTRGQGSSWSVGDTADAEADGAPAHPGFMTRGILDPATYYYRRVFTDAVRAIAAARSHPSVDPTRIAVTGGSQGGGITIAVAALVPDVAAAMPDVPFLSDFARSITITDRDPYTEVARYLKAHRDHTERVLRTLGFFDVASLGRRATAPALFSVALMDEICRPSTVYAAFNEYGGPKEIVEYPFNDHEGGAGFHDIAKMRWLSARFGGDDPS